MSTNGSNCRLKGFTLVEVSVAIAIAALTVIPAANMMANIQAASIQNEKVMEAGFLARSMLERYVKNADPEVNYSAPFEATRDIDPASGLPFLVRIGIGNETTASAQVDVTLPGGNILSLVTVVKKK